MSKIVIVMLIYHCHTPIEGIIGVGAKFLLFWVLEVNGGHNVLWPLYVY
jgi:hypothetical protein